MTKRFAWQMRKLHKWAGWLAALPSGLILLTGILLILRSQLPWMQMPAAKGYQPGAELTFEEVLTIAAGVPETAIKDLDDVKEVRLLPARGIFQVRTANDYEVQIDAHTGSILSSGLRLTPLMVRLHEGTFFSKGVMLWVFLPASLLLFGLWLTGLVLLAKSVKFKRRLPRAETNLPRQKPSTSLGS